MSQARVSELFAQEAAQGIRVFSGGRDVVDMSVLSDDERDAITYCFDRNLKMIENASPKLAASIRPQREAMVKFAAIAKGTFPEEKIFSYPGQNGGLACDFLNPYLMFYGDITGASGGLGMYYGTDGALGTTQERTWDIPLTTATRQFLLGKSATTFYKGCATSGTHSYVVIFQDGIIELNSTPKIAQLHFKSELMDRYCPVGQQPLLQLPIEDRKMIYQYTTPGIIPISHQTGVNISAQPLYSGVAHLPILGMCFYESEFNLETMVLH